MSIVEDLLEQLDQTRVQLLVALDPLPDVALLEAGANGRFAIVDLLALLTAWEAELVTALMRVDQGKKPDKLLAALANPKSYNAKRIQESKGRDLDRIFDDLQQVRIQLEGWILNFSERSLSNSKRYKWLRGHSLSQMIADASFGNEADYLPEVEHFAKAWLKKERALADATIPLTASAPSREQAVSTKDNSDDNEPN